MPSPIQPSVLAAFCLSLASVDGGSGAHAGDRLPRTPAELTGSRTLDARAVELFRATSSAPAASQAKAVAKPEAAPVAPPAPPKLPYAYGGSGFVNGTAVLFLERDSRSILVQVGDVVDGAYRVENLAYDRAVLRYLPLDMRQVLAFGAGNLTEPAPGAAARQPASGPLVVKVPDEAPLGREVPLAFGIPPGSPAAKATIELTYDAEALSVIGAKLLRPGRAVVEINAHDAVRSKQVRLKPIVEEAALTELGIEVIAVDAHGRSVDVRVPPQHTISLVQAN